jgi:hypothetical protein
MRAVACSRFAKLDRWRWSALATIRRIAALRLGPLSEVTGGGEKSPPTVDPHPSSLSRRVSEIRLRLQIGFGRGVVGRGVSSYSDLHEAQRTERRANQGVGVALQVGKLLPKSRRPRASKWQKIHSLPAAIQDPVAKSATGSF